MTDEAVEAAITPEMMLAAAEARGEDARTPEQRAAQAVLDNPRSTRRQREAAWLLLRPVRLKAAYAKPTDPLVKDFYANIEKLPAHRKTGLTRAQLKWLWIGYRVGRMDEQRAYAGAQDVYIDFMMTWLSEMGYIEDGVFTFPDGTAWRTQEARASIGTEDGPREPFSETAEPVSEIEEK